MLVANACPITAINTECVQPPDPTNSVIRSGVAGAVGGVLVLVALAVIIVVTIIYVKKAHQGKGDENTMKPTEKETA